jgi:hypothetical protein
VHCQTVDWITRHHFWLEGSICPERKLLCIFVDFRDRCRNDADAIVFACLEVNSRIIRRNGITVLTTDQNLMLCIIDDEGLDKL